MLTCNPTGNISKQYAHYFMSRIEQRASNKCPGYF